MKTMKQHKSEFKAGLKKDWDIRTREENILVNCLMGFMFEYNPRRYVAATETCLFLMGVLEKEYSYDTLDRKVFFKKFLGFTWTEKETIPAYFERKCREVLTERGVL